MSKRVAPKNSHEVDTEPPYKRRRTETVNSKEDDCVTTNLSSDIDSPNQKSKNSDLICLTLRTNMKMDLDLSIKANVSTIETIKNRIDDIYGISSKFVTIFVRDSKRNKLVEVNDDTRVKDIDTKQLEAVISNNVKETLCSMEKNKNIISISDEIGVFIDSKFYFVNQKITLEQALIQNEDFSFKNDNSVMFVRDKKSSSELIDLNKSLLSQKIRSGQYIFTIDNSVKNIKAYCAYFPCSEVISFNLNGAETVFDLKQTFLVELKKNNNEAKKLIKNETMLDVYYKESCVDLSDSKFVSDKMGCFYGDQTRLCSISNQRNTLEVIIFPSFDFNVTISMVSGQIGNDGILNSDNTEHEIVVNSCSRTGNLYELCYGLAPDPDYFELRFENRVINRSHVTYIESIGILRHSKIELRPLESTVDIHVRRGNGPSKQYTIHKHGTVECLKWMASGSKNKDTMMLWNGIILRDTLGIDRLAALNAEAGNDKLSLLCLGARQRVGFTLSIATKLIVSREVEDIDVEQQQESRFGLVEKRIELPAFTTDKVGNLLETLKSVYANEADCKDYDVELKLYKGTRTDAGYLVRLEEISNDKSLFECKIVSSQLSEKLVLVPVQSVLKKHGVHHLVWERNGKDVAGTVQIFVKNLTGKIVTIETHERLPIWDFKEKLENADGVPANQQRLIHAGRQLDDDPTLADYNIERKSTLHLMLRLKGN